jgi:hypothetical protein
MLEEVFLLLVGAALYRVPDDLMYMWSSTARMRRWMVEALRELQVFNLEQRLGWAWEMVVAFGYDVPEKPPPACLGWVAGDCSDELRSSHSKPSFSDDVRILSVYQTRYFIRDI